LGHTEADRQPDEHEYTPSQGRQLVSERRGDHLEISATFGFSLIHSWPS
jgi:hypothetical protein